MPLRFADIAAAEVAGSARAVAVVGLATGLAALVLFLATLAPSVVGGDAGELMAAARVLGVAHPPGYPTFTLLTHLFGLLPLGSPAIGMNALSAVLDAACVGVVAVTGLVLAGRIGLTPAAGTDRAIAIAGAAFGAGLLAVSTTFWTWSLSAEVFPFNNLLAAATIALVVVWNRDPTRAWPLRSAALLTGLALTNQQTIVLLAPGLFLLYGDGLRRLAATRQPGLVLDWVLIPVGFVLLGLVPYAYLPLAASADPAINWGDPRTIDRLLAVVARQSYGTFSLTVRDTSGTPIDQLVQLMATFAAALTPVGIALGALGWVALARVSRGLGTAFAALVLVSGPLFVILANPPLDDPVTRGVLERFAILPMVVIAMLAGLGAISAGRWAADQIPDAAGRPGFAAAFAMVAALVVLGVAIVHLPAASQRDNRVAETYGRDLLEPLPDGALLLMRSDEHYTTVSYAQIVTGLRPDVVAVDVELLKLPSYVEQLRRRHPSLTIPFRQYDDGSTASLADLIAANLSARPVFLAGKLKEDISARFVSVPWGLTRRLVPAGDAPPADQAAREDGARLAALHPPPGALPDTTWEGVMAANYGSAAFEDAHARQLQGPQADWREVADLYRTAIRLAPALASADKNLGLLLLQNGGDRTEIGTVWRRFLAAEPNDPDADAIRSELDQMGQSGAP